jgi:hypothetical protein
MIRIIPNVLTKEECQTLIKDIDPKSKEDVLSSYNFNRGTDSSYFGGMKKTRCFDHQIIKSVINKFELNAEGAGILYYPEGSENPIHADNGAIQEDGTFKKFKEWKHTAVIFLNDDFIGGQLVYPNHGCSFSPKTGTLIIAPADETYLHYVKPILKGERYSVAIRIL